MKMKKRLLSWCLAVVLACSVFSGCSTPADDKGNSGSGEPVQNEPVVQNEPSNQAENPQNTASFTAVNGEVKEIAGERSRSDEEIGKNYSEFSLNLLKAGLAECKDGNYMVSPASLLFALNMAALGAEGDTYTEMTNVYAEGASKKDIAEFSKNMMEALEKSGQVGVANSLWINSDKPYRADESYLNLIRQYYSASGAQLSFGENPEELCGTINGWIKEKTKGMLENVLDKIEPDAFMYIVNALAFEGKWKEEYQEYQITNNRNFKDAYGKQQSMKSLNSTETTYLSYGGAKGFMKDYEGGELAFVTILPEDESISLDEFFSKQDSDFWTAYYNSRSNEDVITVTPAFKFDYGTEMQEILKKMGMNLAFTEEADFSGMINDEDNGQLMISRVIHKTHIELDETGTKAAAATIIEMEDGCAEPFEPVEIKEVILDRPFAFAIVNKTTGLPIFMGVVNTLA